MHKGEKLIKYTLPCLRRVALSVGAKKINCHNIAEELSQFENGAFSVYSIPGTIDRMEIMAQKMMFES